MFYGRSKDLGLDRPARQAHERHEDLLDRIRSRPGHADQGPSEELACPQCHRTYDFGDVCIDCDVHLVPPSLVGVVEPEKAPTRDSYRLLAFEMAILVASAVSIWGMLTY